MRKVVPTPTRNDPLWALLLTMYHNAHVTKQSDALKVQDFMIYVDPFEEEITVEQMKRNLGLSA